MEPSQALASKIELESNGCWRWLGSFTSNGYGKLRNTVAHKLVYEQMVNKIPNGLQLNHICRNRSCVNPEHLEIVTQRENLLHPMSQAIAAINSRKTHCKRGHPFNAVNTYYFLGRTKRRCKACRRKDMGKEQQQ